MFNKRKDLKKVLILIYMKDNFNNYGNMWGSITMFTGKTLCKSILRCRI